MAINANHPFEELDGRRCAVVERNVSPERVEFIRHILDGNGYTVVVVPSPPPKAAPAPKPVEGEEPPPPAPEPPATFTVGVTDVTFNTVNAIFGRLLRSPEGRGDTRLLAAEGGGAQRWRAVFPETAAVTQEFPDGDRHPNPGKEAQSLSKQTLISNVDP